MDNQGMSPLPASDRIDTLTLSFPDAIREVLNGKKITRLEWNNPEEFGLVLNGYLSIHTCGDYHTWLINDGDLNASDWVVVLEN